jgi:hypothetical protein
LDHDALYITSPLGEDSNVSDFAGHLSSVVGFVEGCAGQATPWRALPVPLLCQTGIVMLCFSNRLSHCGHLLCYMLCLMGRKAMAGVAHGCES